MRFFRFTLLVAVLLSFCIKLAPAQSPPPPSPPPFSLPPCSLNSSWISENAPTDENPRNLTVFKLSFLKNQSLSFTFTTTYRDIEDGAPNLAFITLMRPLEQEPSSTCMREKYTFSEPLRGNLCNPRPQKLQAPISCFSEPADPYIVDSDDAHFMDVVSLMYDAATAALHLQANGATTKEIFSKEYLQAYAVDWTVSNESLTLVVGYITSCGEGSCINVTTGESTMIYTSAESRRVSLVVIHDDRSDHHDSKSNHKVGIIVGVILGFFLLMGLLILVIRKSPLCENCKVDFKFNVLNLCGGG